MDRVATVAISLAIALACVAGAIALTDNESIEPDKEYKVSYVLDNGTLSEDAPKTYTPGKELDIPNPTKDEVIFKGWYLDADLTKFFDGDTTDLTGDITLYAGWGSDLSGHAITFVKSGYYERGMNSYDISGSLTCTYLYYSEEMGSYYIRNDDVTTYNYKYIQQTYTETDSSLYWSSEVERESEDLGIETIDTVYGPKECEVIKFYYDNGITETQWVEVDGWITYKMLSHYEVIGLLYKVEYNVEYNLESESVTEVESDCEITIIEGYGIDVSGYNGPYKPGTSVTLTATTESGGKFGGWYDENFVLLSKEKTYKFVIGGSMTVYALNSSDSDLTLISDEELDLNEALGTSGGTFVITNIDTDETFSTDDGKFMFADGGMYNIVSRSAEGNGYFVVKVTGDVDRTFTWTYNKAKYTVTLGIDYDDYLYAKNLYKVKERCQSNDHKRDKTFVTYSYTDERMAPYMEELVDKMIAALKERHSNVSEKVLLEYILAFTQYIEYQSDEEYMGTVEYWKFPLETLYEEGGDCEDTSILFCAIAHECREKFNMSYRTAIWLLPGHMAGAVWKTNDTDWSYAETTTTGFKLGDIPSSMQPYTKNYRYSTVVEVA